MNTEFYKEYYQNEINRVEIVNGRLQWSISIWIVLLGGILVCFNNIEKAIGFNQSYYLAIGTASFLLTVAIVLLCIGMWGTKSKRLPKLSLLVDHFSKLENHYNGYSGFEEEHNKQFDKFLRELYVEITDDLLIKNDKKMVFCRYANVSMILSALFIVIAFCLLLPNILGL